MSNNVPTAAEWQQFRQQLKRLSRIEIANERYSGEWGPYDPVNPQNSGWRVREANRYLTELKRRDDALPVTVGIWVGVAAVFVAVLAMPLDKSVLTETIGYPGALRLMQFVLVIFPVGTVAFFAWQLWVRYQTES